MYRRRILVADDQPTLRRVVRKHLVGQGFDVVEAADGEEVLRKVAEFSPDLLVLDVMMPGMDGFQVLERLQAVPGTMNIPVVFLTARASERDRIQGLSLGAHDYVSKPFSLSELSLRIGKLLETKERIETLVEYGQRDEVTGLPRRSWFETSLKQAVRRHGSRLGMVFLSFEGLENVTAADGLAGVDEALGRAAEVLQARTDERTEAFWVGPSHAAVLRSGTDSEELASLEAELGEELESALGCSERGVEVRVQTASGMYFPEETIEEFVDRVTESVKGKSSDRSVSRGARRGRRLLPSSSHPSTSRAVATDETGGPSRGRADSQGAKVIQFPGNRRKEES